MTETPVQLSFEDSLAVIRVNNPPVNALGEAVRLGLAASLDQIESRTDIRAVLLICEGRTFFAGADIREFNSALTEPSLPVLCSQIEAARVPWLAVLHGTVLGGGLEVALACRWRVAAPGTRLGLPEVLIGVIPGAGGTVRLPRVLGIPRALEMITTGTPIDAKAAMDGGLVDKLAEGDLEADARQFLAQALTQPLPVPTGARPAPQATPQEWAEAHARVLQQAQGALAPLRAYDSLRYGTEAPLSEALRYELAQFMACHGSPQAQAMQHLFFIERSLARPASLAGVAPAPGVVWSRTLRRFPDAGEICVEDHTVITGRLAELSRDSAPELLAALVPALAKAGLTPVITGAPLAGELAAICAEGPTDGLARFGWPAGPHSGAAADDATMAVLQRLIDRAAAAISAGQASAEDIDLITVHGLGLARWRGGLMHWAKAEGLV